ncbi:MAG: LysR family transcriptional regulator [Myxococcota bacterium]
MLHRAEILSYWNWLPAFRSVAETEHLPTAADRTHVTAAALSRTVRLLEDELGRPLFARRGRGLQLNADGEVLLRAVRRAMRVVHDAHRELQGRRFEGDVRVAAGGVGRVYAMEAMLRCREQYPAMTPWFLTPDPGTVVEQLLIGDLDVVVGSFVLRAPGVETELLCHATSSVYCGPQHVLYGREGVTLDELRHHAFCAPPAGPGGATTDGWPPELARDVRLVVDRLETGLGVCADTDLLAVLPDPLALQSRVPLHRLALDALIPATPVVVMLREPTGADDLTRGLVAALREVCAAPPQRSVPSR